LPRQLYEDEEQYVDEEENLQEEQGIERVGWLRSMPYWALSALLHLILIVFFICMVTTMETKREKEVTTVVSLPSAPKQAPPPQYDPTKKRSTKRTPKVPGARNPKAETPIVLKKEVPEDQVAADIPQGTSLENLTNTQIDASGGVSKGINTGIGLGGGAAGAYGERWGKGSLTQEGGSEGTEDVVLAALEWLRRHQSPEGCWKSASYTDQCKRTCQNTDSRYGDSRGSPEHDVGVTALAMLAFAGYGQTHREGVYQDYVQCLRKAVDYMKKAQVHSNDPSTNGRYGEAVGEQWIYDHSIATMAMGELLVMSNDVIGLKSSVTDAVKLILRAQNDGRGWRYGIKPGDNDTSVTGWMVLALKTAKQARLDIPKEEFDRAFAGAINWFNFATDAKGKTGYFGPGDPGSMLASLRQGDFYPYSKELSCMTAVGVLCRIFSGESRKSQSVRDGVKILMKESPRWQEQKGRSLSSVNMYYWYYGSYALFQFGGPDWKKWNEDMQKALLDNQRAGADICEDGSWDPIDEWGSVGGRVYSTAIGAMTFEVYYRFRRMQTALGEDQTASAKGG